MGDHMGVMQDWAAVHVRQGSARWPVSVAAGVTHPPHPEVGSRVRSLRTQSELPKSRLRRIINAFLLFRGVLFTDRTVVVHTATLTSKVVAGDC